MLESKRATQARAMNGPGGHRNFVDPAAVSNDEAHYASRPMAGPAANQFRAEPFNKVTRFPQIAGRLNR